MEHYWTWRTAGSRRHSSSPRPYQRKDVRWEFWVECRSTPILFDRAVIIDRQIFERVGRDYDVADVHIYVILVVPADHPQSRATFRGVNRLILSQNRNTQAC